MWTAVFNLIHKRDEKKLAEEFEQSLESAKSLSKKSKSLGKRTQSLGFININRIHPDTTRSPAELVPAEVAPVEEDYPTEGAACAIEQEMSAAGIEQKSSGPADLAPAELGYSTGWDACPAEMGYSTGWDACATEQEISAAGMEHESSTAQSLY